MNKSQCLSIALGVSLAMIIAPASAERQGPRASVSSSTTCSLHLNTGAVLEVTTTLENKSSGNTVPEVRGGSMIQGTYKVGRGSAFKTFVEQLDIDAPTDIDPMLMFTAEFDLCKNGGVREELAGARELNGLATIYYGVKDGEEEDRMVVNRCTDPDPDDGVDQGGIRLADFIAAIEAACAQNP